MANATTYPPRRHAQQNRPPEPKSPPATMALFALGLFLLICCALVITHLGQWADDHGQILVFVAFFIAMSLAGRWFWAGIDAALSRLRSH